MATLLDYVMFGVFFASFGVSLITVLWAGLIPSNREFFGWKPLLTGSWWWAPYKYDHATSGKRRGVLIARVAFLLCIASLVGILLTR